MSPSSWKSGHFQKLSPPPFAIRAGNWPLVLKLGHNIWIWSSQICDTWPSFCFTWIWSWQKHQLWIVDCQSHTELIYLLVISEWRWSSPQSYGNVHARLPVTFSHKVVSRWQTSVFVAAAYEITWCVFIPSHLFCIATINAGLKQKYNTVGKHHWNFRPCKTVPTFKKHLKTHF